MCGVIQGNKKWKKVNEIFKVDGEKGVSLSWFIENKNWRKYVTEHLKKNSLVELLSFIVYHGD